MADNFKYVAGKDYRLATGVTSTETTITLSDLASRSGDTLTMADFGTIGYATIAPGLSSMELISFTGISGTQLTGVTRGLKFEADYTADAALRKPHSAGTIVRFTNAPGFYDQFVAKNNDETIDGLYTFDGDIPQVGTYVAPTLDEELAPKKYVDDIAIAGAPDATTTVKGIVELATGTEAAAGTATGSTGASLVPPNSLHNDTSSAARIIPVTGTDGKLDQGFLDLTENFVFEGEVDIDTATNWKLGGTAYTGTMDDLNNVANIPVPVSVELQEDITATELVYFVEEGGATKARKVRGEGSETTATFTQDVDAVDFTEDIVVGLAAASTNRYLRVASITGKTISVGSELDIGGQSNVVDSDVFMLTPSLGVVYSSRTNVTPDVHEYSVFTVSGTTISDPNISDQFTETGTLEHVKLNATQVVCSYSSSKARVITASPSSISIGAEQSISGLDGPMFRLSDSRYFTFNGGNFIVFSVSGETITSQGSVSATGSQGYALALYEDQIGVLGYSDGTDYYLGRLVESGGTITVSKGTKIIDSTTSIGGIAIDDFGNVCVIQGTTAYIYRETSTGFALRNSYTLASSKTAAATTGAWATSDNYIVSAHRSSTSADDLILESSSYDWKDTVGYLVSGGLDGDTDFIQNYGEKTGLSSIPVNSKLYVQEDGSVSEVVSDKYLGRGLTSTTMLIDIDTQ